MYKLLYEEYAIFSIRLDKDVHSLSEFRARVAWFVDQVRLTSRPLLLAQHGCAVAIVIDVREFEAMRERLEFLERNLQRDAERDLDRDLDREAAAGTDQDAVPKPVA